MIIDEVIYAARPPWPQNVATNGNALQRREALVSGSDPANWLAVPATLVSEKVLISEGEVVIQRLPKDWTE